MEWRGAGPERNMAWVNSRAEMGKASGGMNRQRGAVIRGERAAEGKQSLDYSRCRGLTFRTAPGVRLPSEATPTLSPGQEPEPEPSCCLSAQPVCPLETVQWNIIDLYHLYSLHTHQDFSRGRTGPGC